LTNLFYLSIAQDPSVGKSTMIAGNIYEFEGQISYSKSRGKFLFESMCAYEQLNK
jgi:hypothetical protein